MDYMEHISPVRSYQADALALHLDNRREQNGRKASLVILRGEYMRLSSKTARVVSMKPLLMKEHKSLGYLVRDWVVCSTTSRALALSRVSGEGELLAEEFRGDEWHFRFLQKFDK